jgi:hypothetical protein
MEQGTAFLFIMLNFHFPEIIELLVEQPHAPLVYLFRGDSDC